jgi:hypothetical protein
MITARYITTDPSKPITIHLCKDRTLSYRDRTKNEPVFNGVAVPVLSVESAEIAEQLLLLVGTRQYEPHPHPRYPHTFWYRLFNGVANGKQYLDPEDVPEAEEYLHRAYLRLCETIAGRSAAETEA